MKQRIINKLLSYLLSAINPDDIITAKKGKLYLGKNEIGEMELKSLIAEAKALEGFRIWGIMQETVREEAMKKGFNESLRFDDLVTCKLMLYNLDVLKSIVRVIRAREK